jgi:hypothetical protein
MLAAAVLGFAADRSSEATGPAVVRLTDAQTTYDHLGTWVGAGEIARFTLFGSKSTTRAIGHGVIQCTYVGDSERNCTGTYILPRGTIETAGILRSRLLYTQAIIGGTGLFDNARGTLTVTAKQIKPRREILLFRLTG